jgi:hypothetical protein
MCLLSSSSRGAVKRAAAFFRRRVGPRDLAFAFRICTVFAQGYKGPAKATRAESPQGDVIICSRGRQSLETKKRLFLAPQARGPDARFAWRGRDLRAAKRSALPLRSLGRSKESNMLEGHQSAVFFFHVIIVVVPHLDKVAQIDFFNVPGCSANLERSFRGKAAG